MNNIVLIHSPLVSSCSLFPTADALKRLGSECFVPSPMARAADIPSWSTWPELLLRSIPSSQDTVVVGHSMGGLLAARLAGDLEAKGIILLDANIPPDKGPVEPTERSFRQFIETLPVINERLPPWHEWWSTDLFEGTTVEAELKNKFYAEAPRIMLQWFDDAFEMSDWSGCEVAMIQTSTVFSNESKKAEERGWPVVRLQGTHLYPTTHAEETANAILQCCDQFSLS